MGMGFSTTHDTAAAVPPDLAELNMPGRTLFTSLEWGAIATTNVLGTAGYTFHIPPGFGGVTLYNQAIVFDPHANEAGITISNAAKAKVGYLLVGESWSLLLATAASRRQPKENS